MAVGRGAKGGSKKASEGLCCGSNIPLYSEGNFPTSKMRISHPRPSRGGLRKRSPPPHAWIIGRDRDAARNDALANLIQVTNVKNY